jgi:hypothetical protein
VLELSVAARESVMFSGLRRGCEDDNATEDQVKMTRKAIGVVEVVSSRVKLLSLLAESTSVVTETPFVPSGARASLQVRILEKARIVEGVSHITSPSSSTPSSS